MNNNHTIVLHRYHGYNIEFSFKNIYGKWNSRYKLPKHEYRWYQDDFHSPKENRADGLSSEFKYRKMEKKMTIREKIL